MIFGSFRVFFALAAALIIEGTHTQRSHSDLTGKRLELDHSLTIFAATINQAGEVLKGKYIEEITSYLLHPDADVVCLAQQEGGMDPWVYDGPVNGGQEPSAAETKDKTLMANIQEKIRIHKKVTAAELLKEPLAREGYSLIGSSFFVGTLKETNRFIGCSCFRKEWVEIQKFDAVYERPHGNKVRLKGGASIIFEHKGKRFAFSSVHLNTIDGREKREQFEAVMEKVKGFGISTHVIAGDFNFRLIGGINTIKKHVDMIADPSRGSLLAMLDAADWYSKAAAQGQFSLPTEYKTNPPRGKELMTFEEGEVVKENFDLISSLWTAQIPPKAFPSYSFSMKFADPSSDPCKFLFDPQVNPWTRANEPAMEMRNDTASLKEAIKKCYFGDTFSNSPDSQYPQYVYAKKNPTICDHVGYTDRVVLDVDPDVQFRQDKAHALWGVKLHGKIDHGMVAQKIEMMWT